MSTLSGGRRVAVIGGGPSGLAVAKHLVEQGFEPLVLEQSDDLGGQWHVRGPHSGVWEGMRTNTSKTLTAFSDFPPPAALPMFPRAEQIHAYLHAYAERFGVRSRVRTEARVVEVARAGAGDGWTVRWSDEASGRLESAVFDGVVVASGRFSKPAYPDVPGLREFARHGRLLHAFDYRTRDELRGARVLVYGNSISGLEIASDLAMDDSIAVVSACRRPRFVIQKVVKGLPADWQWFTRFAALLGAALPPEALAAGLRKQVLEVAGDPAAFGGLTPHEDILATGLSQAQHYLALVAEDRIAVRPGIAEVDGDVVVFEDGSREQVDAIVCATGYALDLPYLSQEIRTALAADDTYLDLYQRTLHPDLPGLGFVGQYVLQGPYFPVLELQARWLAALWSGAVDAPGEQRMRAGIEEYRAMKPILRSDVHHVLAGILAAESGVAPSLTARPHLTAALLFGPLAPAQYRLDGPGALAEAEEQYLRAIAEFGDGPCANVGPEHLAGLRIVAEALGDPVLSDVAARVAGDEPVAVTV
jgi:cation diffusion facilitator CzcD-associated flavoprotein CzcO